jgi:hypothetical protein
VRYAKSSNTRVKLGNLKKYIRVISIVTTAIR